MQRTIGIVYATWHGQAEKVARRIADVAYMHGVATQLLNAKTVPRSLAVDRYAAIIAVASVHFGRHPGSIVDFVRRNLPLLNRVSTAFVSVSGAAGALHGEEEAQRYIHNFIAKTSWQPDMTLSVGGAVPYSKYDFVTRALMRFSSRIAGRDSDTSSDYEYTNWFAVEHFAREFIAELGLGERGPGGAKAVAR